MGSTRTCEAWQLLQQLLMRQLVRLPEIAGELELSPAQCHVMRLLDPEKPQPMGRLADHLSCDASNVTGIVDRLEARGLVRRGPSPGDRRVRVIALTATGATLRQRLLARLYEPPAEFASLSPDDQRRLTGLLRKALGALERAGGNTRPE